MRNIKLNELRVLDLEKKDIYEPYNNMTNEEFNQLIKNINGSKIELSNLKIPFMNERIRIEYK